jgi:hypothetical protein
LKALIWLTLATAIIALYAHGVAYWNSHPSSISWDDCFYGSSACSAAAATWTLAAFALSSFIAAIYAVRGTYHLLSLEEEPKLGQSGCTRRGQGHPPDIRIFVQKDGLILFKEPVGFARGTASTEYRRREIAFTNLGRSALTKVTAQMRIGNDTDRHTVNLGNIIRDQEVHVTLYVARSYGMVPILWRNACQDDKRIDFYPRDEDVPETLYGIVPPQLALPGIKGSTNPYA